MKFVGSVAFLTTLAVALALVGLAWLIKDNRDKAQSNEKALCALRHTLQRQYGRNPAERPAISRDLRIVPKCPPDERARRRKASARHKAAQAKTRAKAPQAVRKPLRAPSARPKRQKGPQAGLNPPKRHLRAQRPQAPAPSQPAPTLAPQPVLPEQRQGPPPNVLERICTQLDHLIPPCS